MPVVWLCWAVFMAALLLPVPGNADPQLDYVLHCQGCHGADGAGSVDGAPPFAGNLGRFARTEQGRAYLVRVPGVAHAELDDQRLAALLNWLLARFDPAASDFPPFTADEVRAGRQRPLLSVPQARRQVLEHGQP